MFGAIGCTETVRSDVSPPRPPPQDSPSLDPAVRDAIVKYVQETRKWDRSRYVIQTDLPEGGLERYLIGHLDNVERPRPGGGLSFVVCFDRTSLRVVRELGFQ
jgi:hypothetical protein